MRGKIKRRGAEGNGMRRGFEGIEKRISMEKWLKVRRIGYGSKYRDERFQVEIKSLKIKVRGYS